MRGVVPIPETIYVKDSQKAVVWSLMVENVPSFYQMVLEPGKLAVCGLLATKGK